MLKILLPFLIIKHERAALVLRLWELRRMKHKQRDVSTEEIETILKIRQLNLPTTNQRDLAQKSIEALENLRDHLKNGGTFKDWHYPPFQSAHVKSKEKKLGKVRS